MNRKKIISELKKAVLHRNIFSLSADMVFHKLVINTHPRDYFKFEFYKKGKSLEEKSRYISLRGSRYFPYGNNPLKYNNIFTNKYIQKSILKHFKLPVADLITTIGKQLEISDQESLNHFLDTFKTDIVIKPINGTHGTGFLSLSRKDKHLVAGKQIYTKDDVWKQLGQGFARGYIVEEKLINSEAIRLIHPESLNTFRFQMIKTDDGRWHNAACAMKFGTGDSQVDNAIAGGIVAEVDTNGKILSAYHYLSVKPVTHHPDSGRPLVGIHLEGYPEAAQLALEASRKFNFMGSIGWDIAPSVNGPIIVEANAWSGDPQKQIGKGLISDELARGLKKRHLFSSWDKTKMHPFMNKRSWINRLKKIAAEPK